MPSNVLRNTPRKGAPSGGSGGAGRRQIVITIGAVTIRAALAPTLAAQRLWDALPLYARAETWGESVHVELPIESGRERGARLTGKAGEIYWWADDDRILIPFGPTPISRPGEIRLPKPCNILATTSDDVTALRGLTPGVQVSIARG